jgi:hypothetical protein
MDLLCPCVHNISGALHTSGPVGRDADAAAHDVDPRLNFGNCRGLYTIAGNLLYSRHSCTIVFKGATSLAALCQVTSEIADTVDEVTISMAVFTVALNKKFPVRTENSDLYTFIAVELKGSQVHTAEDSSNHTIFRIARWDTITTHDLDASAVCSLSRSGICTARFSFHGKRDPSATSARLQHAQNAIENIAHKLASWHAQRASKKDAATRPL